MPEVSHNTASSVGTASIRAMAATDLAMSWGVSSIVNESSVAGQGRCGNRNPSSGVGRKFGTKHTAFGPWIDAFYQYLFMCAAVQTHDCPCLIVIGFTPLLRCFESWRCRTRFEPASAG